MKSSKSNQPVLGVMVSARTVHAVLVQMESSGPVVMRRFVRQRNTRSYAMASKPQPMALVPELQEETSGSDFTIQFGDGAGANDLFLKQEFGGFQAANTGEPGSEDTSERTANFMYELAEILEECQQAGVEKPQVAFCVTSSEISSIELHVAPKARKGKKETAEANGDAQSGAGKAPSRDQLLSLLKEQYKGHIDTEAVGFMAMTPSEVSGLRYIAFVPKKNEPVSVTIKAIRKQKDERPPNVRLLDTEGTLMLGMARRALRAIYASEAAGDGKKDAQLTVPTNRRTLVVRTGAEDTLLFFMDGERLRHFESMRSLTAFDSPDTICSRVLLQQDEYGVEEVHHVLLLSEEREEQLVESFETFFPDAEVTPLREYLPSLGVGPGLEANVSPFIPAIGVALRLIETGPNKTVFEDINLLSRKMIRQKVELPFTWHIAVLGLLLFGTALFFGSRYVVMEQNIDEYRERLRHYPPTLADEDPRALQARIDSMQNLYNGYMHALGVLDTLLIGSDQWSRSLEDLSSETAAIRGLWVDVWQPQGSMVVVEGNATSRDRVVSLAERLDGNIRSLTFSEIREWPVYSFSMEVPIEQQLPEAATYLREHALVGEGQPEAAAAPAAHASR